jgi:hypothetical protein
MSEDLKEGRIQAAMHSKLIDITKLKALIDVRSENKKWLR